MNEPRVPVAEPTKSQTLRVLRKVFPGARFQERTADGVKTVEFFYRPPGSRAEAPAAVVVVPEGGTVSGACKAILIGLFEQLGGRAVWTSGRYHVGPIKNYVGPEQQIPVELDPAVPVDLDKVETALEAERLGEITHEQAQRNIKTEINRALNEMES